MKKFVLLAASAASALAFAAPAFAAPVSTTVSTTVTVNGTVPKQCGVGNQSGDGQRVAGSDVVTIANLTDANGFLANSDQDIEFDNVWCNSSSTITMTTTDLSTSSPVGDPTSFVTYLDMLIGNDANARVLPTYFGVQSIVSNGATPGTATATIPVPFETGTGKYSKASLHLQLPANTAGNDRPVAGSYTGVVTFTATPNT